MRWLAVAIALACGCGDNIAGTEVVDFDLEVYRARCAYLTRCGLFTDSDTCEAYFRLDPDESRIEAVKAGQMRYDAVAAKGCTEEMAELTCDQSTRDVRVESELCRQAFRGGLSPGKECAFDAECKSGECEGAECPAETCCYGTCTGLKEPSGIDGACESTRDCIDDAWCGEDKKCHALVAIAGECELDEQCEYGSGCIGATEFMPGACRTLPLLGEPCPYKRCAELGARCEMGTCVPVGLPGDACDMDSDCSPHARCDQQAGMCLALETLGMPCITRCAGESWCDFDGTKTCREMKEDTTPCQNDAQCASGYCASGVFFRFCSARAVCY